MWPFKSVKTLKESGMFVGFTDWHSHILPGVDDGIPTLEDSLAVLSAYEELGFKKVWLTPHIMEDYPNTPVELRQKFEELRKAWTGKVEIKLAAENMLDSLFDERLEAGDLLPIGEEGRHLLVETSYYTPPIDFEDKLDRIKAKGYYPVLAHPERYRYMEEKDYKRLKANDILFQMNFASIIGGYGETAQKKAEWLLKNNMVDLTGSDVHRLNATMSMIESKPKKQQSLDLMVEITGRSVNI